MRILSAVIRGQYFHDILKSSRKLALAFVPHCTGNGGDTFAAVPEQPGRFHDAVVLHIRGNRHPVYGLKYAFQRGSID